MPSSLALLLTLAFIAFLFARDIREKANVTKAIWLPFLWIVISPSTRFLSQWLSIFGFHVGGVTVEDGSPIDGTFYFILIACGFIILNRRRVSIVEFARNNRWLTIYLIYCLLAIAWSDFPFVSAKRWIKLLGDPVMALVLLTEPDPVESITRVIKRCAYIMFPLSILFIKYFPDLGRTFDEWSGQPINTGIATNKNELGFDCWIVGAVLFWRLLQILRWEHGKAQRNELLLCGGLLGMDLWVLKMAQSASSLVALALVIGVILFLGLRWVHKQRVSFYIATGVIIATVCFGLGLSGAMIHLLGRNDTLTGRTDIWHALWNWDINPFIGTGFESFWLGERRQQVQDSILPFLNEAHNGYLETYLNLGIVGVAITLAILLATYVKSRRALFHDFEFGRFRIGYLISFIFYNWTEAAFRLNAFPFFIFFLIAIDYPTVRAEAPVAIEDSSDELFKNGAVLVAAKPQIFWS